MLRRAARSSSTSSSIDDGSGADASALGAVRYEEALARGSPERDFGPRSPDDRYILYTGGTTGMPKGVVWRHEDVFYRARRRHRPDDRATRVDQPEQMVEKGLADGPDHVPADRAAHARRHAVGVMGQSFVGNKVVLVAKFDADRVWRPRRARRRSTR